MGRYFPNGKITQIHGKPRYDDGRAYYPLFHPAAVLRNPGLEKDMEADFRRLLEVLAEVKKLRGSQSGASKPEDEPPQPPLQLKLF
jgi:uracil-DNA glycosylase